MICLVIIFNNKVLNLYRLEYFCGNNLYLEVLIIRI